MGEENGKKTYPELIQPSWGRQNSLVQFVELWSLNISAQKETTTWDFEVYYEVIGRLRLKHRSRPARNADFSALFLACFFLIMFMHLVSESSNQVWDPTKFQSLKTIQAEVSWNIRVSLTAFDSDRSRPWKVNSESVKSKRNAESYLKK